MALEHLDHGVDTHSGDHLSIHVFLGVLDAENQSRLNWWNEVA